jgi:hypothetical protein
MAPHAALHRQGFATLAFGGAERRRDGDVQEQHALSRGHGQKSRPHPAVSSTAWKGRETHGERRTEGRSADAARPRSELNTAADKYPVGNAGACRAGPQSQQSCGGSNEDGDSNRLSKSHSPLASTSQRTAQLPTKDGVRDRPSFRSIPTTLFQAPPAAPVRPARTASVPQDTLAGKGDNRDSRHEREGERRAKMGQALVTLMSKLQDPTKLCAVQTMMQRWMSQRCVRSAVVAFEYWRQGAVCSSFQRRCHRSASGRVWSEWCQSTQQTLELRIMYARILHRDVAACFMAWRSQTERFKTESSLIADINYVESVLARKVLCLEQVLSDTAPRLVRDKCAASDFYKAQAANLRQQKQALESELLQLQGQLRKEKMRGDWLEQQVTAMAVLAATLPQTQMNRAAGRPERKQGGGDDRRPLARGNSNVNVVGEDASGGAALTISSSPMPQRPLPPAEFETLTIPRSFQLGGGDGQLAVISKNSPGQMRDITLLRCVSGRVGLQIVKSFHADVPVLAQNLHRQLREQQQLLLREQMGMMTVQGIGSPTATSPLKPHVCYVITHLKPNAPAILSGKVQEGDHIWRIDDNWTFSLSPDQVTSMLSGAPGSSVVITVSSPSPRSCGHASSTTASMNSGSPGALLGGEAENDTYSNKKRSSSPMRAPSPGRSIKEVLIQRGDHGGLGIR